MRVILVLMFWSTDLLKTGLAKTLDVPLNIVNYVLSCGERKDENQG